MRLRSSWMAAMTLAPISLLQGQTSPDSRDYTIVSDVKLVLLDVAARDAGGGFVSGLRREDFHLFDNGKEQPITAFSGEDTPVTVGILVDRSGSMRNKRNEVANAALALIGASNPQDEIFVVSFGDRVTFDLPPHVSFTDDRNLLRAALGKETPQGRTSLYDALIASIEHLANGSRARKTLVVISDGGDTASQCTAGEVFSMVKSAGVTVHALCIYDQKVNEAARNLGFLRKLTDRSGGQLVMEEPKTDLMAACLRIAKDIRSRYTMGFRPPDVVGPQTRKLRVTISAAGQDKLAARTREYYSIPAPEKPGP